MTNNLVHGFVADRFAPVRDLFENNLLNDDVGASFCATIDGEIVVDLWGGFADAARTRPWEKNTIVNVYSTTKTVTALVMLLLADRGAIDFTAPVAKYWSEFRANGKEHITVAHVMSHSSGMSGWREPITKEDLYDWDRLTALLAAQAPLWEPGTASGYHVLTFGYLLGEIVRRVTGKTLGTVFREEIAKPLGADFHIGLPASEDARVAELIEYKIPPGRYADFKLSEIQELTVKNMTIDVQASRTREWLGAEIPAVNGQGNARSVARVQSILANGGIARLEDGSTKRIMSEAGCRKALEQQIEGPDLVMMGMPARFGLGFALPGPLLKLAFPNPNTLFWTGAGGSVIVIDMDAHATYAYAMNKMDSGPLGDPRSFRLIESMWQAMG